MLGFEIKEAGNVSGDDAMGEIEGEIGGAAVSHYYRTYYVNLVCMMSGFSCQSSMLTHIYVKC